MNLAEMRTEVFRLLRESATAPIFWAVEDVDRSLNEGYAEMSDASEWYERHQYIHLLEDQRVYDMRTVAHHPFLVAGPAFNETTNRWLTATSPRTLDAGDLEWESRVEEPHRVLPRGLFHLMYWPYKGQENGRIKQYYIALPPPLIYPEDEPGFPPVYHYALVHYALFDLYAQDAESSLAWMSWKEYLTYEDRLGGHPRGKASLPHNRSHSPTPHDP